MPCHIFMSFSVNTWNFWVNLLVPYFVHMMECLSLLCLKVSCVIHLQWEWICLSLRLHYDSLRSQPLFWAFTHQYFEFLSKLFCSTLFTYDGVPCTSVPQSFTCNPSAIGVNLFKHKIGSFIANTEGWAVNLFPPAFIHMGPWDTTNTNIFISGNICYGWFNIWYCNLAQMWLLWLTQPWIWNSDFRFWISLKIVARWYMECPVWGLFHQTLF
jgi:hypothetical protein